MTNVQFAKRKQSLIFMLIHLRELIDVINTSNILLKYPEQLTSIDIAPNEFRDMRQNAPFFSYVLAGVLSIASGGL